MEEELPRPILGIIVKTTVWPVMRVEVWHGDEMLQKGYAVGFSRTVMKGARMLLQHKGRIDREEAGAAREPKDVTGRLDGGYA